MLFVNVCCSNFVVILDTCIESHSVTCGGESSCFLFVCVFVWPIHKVLKDPTSVATPSRPLHTFTLHRCTMAASLSRLPNELMLMVAEHIPLVRDLNALMKVCRGTHQLLEKLLLHKEPYSPLRRHIPK